MQTSDNFNSNPISFINSFNQNIAFTIPVLTSFLQLKKDDLFTTRPKTMYLAVSTTVVFYMVYITLLRFPVHGGFADHCLLSIGTASIASLTSALLPDSLSPFVFAVFGLLYAIQLIYWLYHQYNTWKLLVLVFFYNIWTAFRKITGQPQPILHFE